MTAFPLRMPKLVAERGFWKTLFLYKFVFVFLQDCSDGSDERDCSFYCTDERTSDTLIKARQVDVL